MTRAPRTAGVAGIALVFVLTGCASAGPSVRADPDTPIEVEASDAHRFVTVRLRNHGPGSRLWGTVEHRHTACPEEGHVVVAVVGPDGGTERRESLPLVRRAARHPGWGRADFRVEWAEPVPHGARLRLSFHDGPCGADPTFPCCDPADPPSSAARAAD